MFDFLNGVVFPLTGALIEVMPGVGGPHFIYVLIQILDNSRIMSRLLRSTER